MKKTILSLLPFAATFALATGSVIAACAISSPERTSINTGVDQDGRIYSNFVFTRIDSVTLINLRDRSKKTDLAAGSWDYDETTSELTIRNVENLKDYVVTVEGSYRKPPALILNAISSPESLLVILDRRLAVEGYDYTFDPESRCLTFRNDVNLDRSSWYVSYDTEIGSACIGNGNASDEQNDIIAYAEAEKRYNALKRFYESHSEFWFMDRGDGPDGKPELVFRKPTEKEWHDMTSYPVTVLKARPNAQYRKLSKEVGFNAKLPEEIAISGSESMKLILRMIEESTKGGTVRKSLTASYGNGSNDSFTLLSLSLNPGPQDQEGEYTIKEETVDLGLPVRKHTAWCMQSGNPEERPVLAQTISWTWTDGTVYCTIEGNAERAPRIESMIRKIIAFRNGKKR